MAEISGSSPPGNTLNSGEAGEISTLGHTTQEVYRGAKGSFHRKHRNKRVECKTDWEQKFMDLICGGDEEEYDALKTRFHILNKNTQTTSAATAMLCVLGSAKQKYPLQNPASPMPPARRFLHWR